MLARFACCPSSNLCPSSSCLTPGVSACLPLQAVGRQNFGCDQGGWDFKGLTSQNVTLNGAPA